jgi:hypothetical protein
MTNDPVQQSHELELPAAAPVLVEVQAGYALVSADGTVVELDEAPDELLAEWLATYAELAAAAVNHRNAVVREVIRRADARGARQFRAGDFTVKVDAPPAKEYDGSILRAGLEELAAAGVIDAEALDACVPLRPHPLARGIENLRVIPAAAKVIDGAVKPSRRNRGASVHRR